MYRIGENLLFSDDSKSALNSFLGSFSCEDKELFFFKQYPEMMISFISSIPTKRIHSFFESSPLKEKFIADMRGSPDVYLFLLGILETDIFVEELKPTVVSYFFSHPKETLDFMNLSSKSLDTKLLLMKFMNRDEKLSFLKVFTDPSIFGTDLNKSTLIDYYSVHYYGFDNLIDTLFEFEDNYFLFRFKKISFFIYEEILGAPFSPRSFFENLDQHLKEISMIFSEKHTFSYVKKIPLKKFFTLDSDLSAFDFFCGFLDFSEPGLLKNFIAEIKDDEVLFNKFKQFLTMGKNILQYKNIVNFIQSDIEFLKTWYILPQLKSQEQKDVFDLLEKRIGFCSTFLICGNYIFSKKQISPSLYQFNSKSDLDQVLACGFLGLFLFSLGFSPKIHQELFEKIKPEETIDNLLFDLLMTCDKEAIFSEDFDVVLFIRQALDIEYPAQILIEKINSLATRIKKGYSIIYGPLNMSHATDLLNNLIKLILSGKPYFVANEPYFGYVLNISSEKYFLSHLLTEANLSHLLINKERLLSFFNEHYKDKLLLRPPANQKGTLTLNKLEPCVLDILYNYTFSIKENAKAFYYEDFNLFLRGEVVDGIDPVFYLICAAILTISLYELRSLIEENEFLSPYVALHRTEYFASSFEMERRFVSIPRIRGFTSTNRQGGNFSTEYAGKNFEVKTQILNYSHMPSIEEISECGGVEKEVLIPPGYSRYTLFRNKEHNFVNLVSSPSFEEDNYITNLALSYAMKEHLSKPFQDRSSADLYIEINQVKIERPNHGLAHTYRVTHYLPFVISYFALHGQGGLQEFCQTISDLDRTCLTIATAFSVTGRESELSFSEDPIQARTYRISSADNIMPFFDTLDLCIKEEEKTQIKERLWSVIRYMGHPDYTSGSTLNQAADPKEKAIRDYLHMILSLAHSLDTPRCFTQKHHEACMKIYASYVVENDAQKSDFIDLQRYALALIKAHGDRCLIDLDQNNEWNATNHHYQPPFQEVSHSVAKLEEIRALVEKPVFKARNSFSKKF